MRIPRPLFGGLGVCVLGLLFSGLALFYRLEYPIVYKFWFVLFGVILSFYLLLFAMIRRK